MFIERLQNYFNGNDVIVSLIILGISIGAALVVDAVIALIFGVVTRRSKREIVMVVLDELKYPLFFFLLIIAMTISMPFLLFSERSMDILQHIISILTIIAVAWTVINIIDVTRAIMLHRYDIQAKDNLQARKVVTQFRVLTRIIYVIIVVIAFAAALMTFGKVRELGMSLLASAGVMGIIIGFAAQRSIATLLAGFQIALTQPIRIDDVVIVEGEWGRIEEITLTYVVVKIWDERRLIVPVTYFIEQPFQNWTRVSADLLGTVFIYADYTAPFDELREELTRLLKGHEKWDGRVNVLQITDAKERTVEIRALMSAADASSAFDLRVHVREKLIAFLQKNHPESLSRTRVELNPIPVEVHQNGENSGGGSNRG